ncbi:hypothetical protein [Burkholderia phage FLC9]|nr:hypothetical protein [Burkholderia phage FLC9]
MRKHFAPTPPSEDARSIKRVSLEEELIIVGDANEEAQACDDRLSEVERLVDLKQALEDLAVIADNIEQPTSMELDLIDNCAQMAVAGTGMAPENLLKGPPLAVGQEIATEGWTDSAQRLWATIKAFMKKIWDHIENFLKVHVVLPSIYARLQLMLRQLKNRTGELRYGQTAQMELTTGLSYLSNGLRIQRSAAEFAQEFEKFNKAVEMVYVANPERVSKLGKDIADTIDNWTGENTDETMNRLVSVIKSSNNATGLPFPMPFSANEGDFKVRSSHEILGCTYFKFATFDGAAPEPLLALERLRNTGLSVEAGDDPKDDEITFKHNGPAVYEKLLKDASDMIQTVARFNKSGGAMKKLRQAGKEIEVSSEEALKALSKEAAEASPALIAEIKMMLNFNPTYARWVQQPAVAFYTKVIGVVRALLMLVQNYVGLYEVKDKGEEQKIMQEMQQGKQAA